MKFVIMIAAALVLWVPEAQAQSLDLRGALDASRDDFEGAVSRNQQRRDQQRAAPARSTGRCVSIAGACIGLDCIIDDITISGGPGVIDNSWSSPSVCTGYNGLEGRYHYVMTTNFDRTCAGSFDIPSSARAGLTIAVYDDCRFNYVSPY